MDYSRKLSPEIISFIDETAQFYPADLDPNDWTAQRACYDAMAAHFHLGRPADLSVYDDKIGDVPIRVYGAPTETKVLYAHGGGFVLGGLESHDDICAEIAERTCLQVVSVDYRPSPEHRHPAAYDDVAAVAEALSLSGKVVLCGDSAGGTLCACLSGTRSDLGFLGQVLIYPMLGYPHEGGSFSMHAHAPMLTSSDLDFYGGVRGGDPDDPRLIPIMGDLSKLPPTWVFPAECDPLCDDAVWFARDTGANLSLHEGMVHGWLRARRRSDQARKAFGQIIEAIISASTSAAYSP